MSKKKRIVWMDLWEFERGKYYLTKKALLESPCSLRLGFKPIKIIIETKGKSK